MIIYLMCNFFSSHFIQSLDLMILIYNSFLLKSLIKNGRAAEGAAERARTAINGLQYTNCNKCK